ncbi:TetR/AcrR family transcriptional regulator [Nocardia alni]|uniref:TetR/AcrR family transcriptional regulator n=1 Tax=Nocardia alni TaxID=2815723 RepID=UPI001C22D595|nr:TetR/AcrR family transcriptional regulator [Nocardia alni]
MPDPIDADSAEASSSGVPAGREPHRQRVIEAAADLLVHGGRDAVTTRAVAAAAGVQAPVIYRLFGDKVGLLEAVAEYGYAEFLATKQGHPRLEDPIEDLRVGWDLAVEFGLSNPALYMLMHSETMRPDSPALQAGMHILMSRIQRLAAAGSLRVDEPLAASVINATARGAVLTWLSQPPDRRDPALLVTMRETMVVAVTCHEPVVPEATASAAARALRATLPDQQVLSVAEQALLGEWLDRLAADQPDLPDGR